MNSHGLCFGGHRYCIYDPNGVGLLDGPKADKRLVQS